VLKDVSPKLMDFDLYALAEKRSGSVRCTLYFGNAPAFPRLRWSGRPTESRQNGGTRKEFRSPDQVEGLMAFEGLSYKGAPMAPFEDVHYFADHLNAADMKVVSAMVDSISVARRSSSRGTWSVQRSRDPGPSASRAGLGPRESGCPRRGPALTGR
jgi:hypothetical protein